MNAHKPFQSNYFMMETSHQLNEIILDDGFRNGEAAYEQSGGKQWIHLNTEGSWKIKAMGVLGTEGNPTDINLDHLKS